MSVDADCQLLIAHLLMAVLSCQLQAGELQASHLQYGHLQAGEAAAAHLAAASGLAWRMPRHRSTLRSCAPMKLARIVATADSLNVTVELPILDETVMTPEASVSGALAGLRKLGAPTAVTLGSLKIVYFRVRVRADRVADAISHLAHASLVETERRLHAILHQCLYLEVNSASAMDMADDYLSLARSFTRLKNPALAGLALQQADAVLSAYSHSTEAGTHADLVSGITGRIPDLLRMINGSSS